MGKEMISVFGCDSAGSNCHDKIARFTVATQWVCSTQYALQRSSGDNNRLGVLYPVEFANPSCNDDNGEKTKSCHGAEGGWVRGNGFGRTDFGTMTSNAYGSFYRNGSIPLGEDYSLFTWEEMGYNDLNRISADWWGRKGY